MATKVKNPATGESYDLGKPKNLLMKVVGGIVAMTITLWSLMVASNTGVPLLNSITSAVGLNASGGNSDGSGNDGLLGEL